LSKKINMKKLMIYSFALLMAGTIVTSCSKYEEGPKLTLASKKARLTGDWKLVSINNNGTTQTVSGYESSVLIEKDGTIKNTVTYSILGTPNTITQNGTWEFSDDKTKVLVKLNGSSNTDEFIIVRLASKELKLKQVDGESYSISTYEAK